MRPSVPTCEGKGSRGTCGLGSLRRSGPSRLIGRPSRIRAATSSPAASNFSPEVPFLALIVSGTSQATSARLCLAGTKGTPRVSRLVSCLVRTLTATSRRGTGCLAAERRLTCRGSRRLRNFGRRSGTTAASRDEI